jgi:hypothetical protein
MGKHCGRLTLEPFATIRKDLVMTEVVNFEKARFDKALDKTCEWYGEQMNRVRDIISPLIVALRAFEADGDTLNNEVLLQELVRVVTAFATAVYDGDGGEKTARRYLVDVITEQNDVVAVDKDANFHARHAVIDVLMEITNFTPEALKKWDEEWLLAAYKPEIPQWVKEARSSKRPKLPEQGEPT